MAKDLFRVINRPEANVRVGSKGCEWIMGWSYSHVLAPTSTSDLKINQYLDKSAIALNQRSSRRPRFSLISLILAIGIRLSLIFVEFSWMFLLLCLMLAMPFEAPGRPVASSHGSVSSICFFVWELRRCSKKVRGLDRATLKLRGWGKLPGKEDYKWNRRKTH